MTLPPHHSAKRDATVLILIRLRVGKAVIPAHGHD